MTDTYDIRQAVREWVRSEGLLMVVTSLELCARELREREKVDNQIVALESQRNRGVYLGPHESKQAHDKYEWKKREAAK